MSNLLKRPNKFNISKMKLKETDLSRQHESSFDKLEEFRTEIEQIKLF